MFLEPLTTIVFGPLAFYMIWGATSERWTRATGLFWQKDALPVSICHFFPHNNPSKKTASTATHQPLSNCYLWSIKWNYRLSAMKFLSSQHNLEPPDAGPTWLLHDNSAYVSVANDLFVYGGGSWKQQAASISPWTRTCRLLGSNLPCMWLLLLETYSL